MRVTKLMTLALSTLLIQHGRWESLSQPQPRPAPQPQPAARVAEAPRSAPQKQTQLLERVAPSTDGGPIIKPGCTAADETLLVHGHLQGLAAGLGGFGVLHESKRRLERAAEAASMGNEPELAMQLRRVAAQLPDVRDEEAAKRVAAELQPLLPVAWEMGRRCGGIQLPPEIIQQVQLLAQRMAAGQISHADALAQIRS